MKPNNLEKNLINLLIFSVVVLCILYFYNIYQNKNVEHFSDTIDIKDNFYDITSGSPALGSGSNQLGNKIGGTNLCIYESSGNRVTDIECISSGEFNNALTLPKSRRETVCIDEECINLKDVKFLLGETPFQIKTGAGQPKQADYKKYGCLGKLSTSVWSCSGHNYGDNIVSYFKDVNCYDEDGVREDDNTLFKLDQNIGMSFKDLQKLGISKIDEPATGSGGGDSQQSPIHS